MEKSIQHFLNILKVQTIKIIKGHYENVDELLQFTDENKNPPEVSTLAEQISLMAIKLEVREMDLENKITLLDKQNENLKNQIKAREEFSLIFILFTLFIGLYTFVASFMNQSHLFSEDALIIARPIANLCYCALLIALTFILIKKTNLPISNFGVTFKNATIAIKESIVVTLLVAAVISLFKLWAMHYLPSFKNEPFISFVYVDWTFWLYFLVAPIQEFIARGVLQSSIARLLIGRYAVLWSIVLASILFGVSHTHYSIMLALITVLGGLLWGYLYHRSKSILGISVSHLLLGNYLILLGLWERIL